MQSEVPEDELEQLNWFRELYETIKEVYDPFFETYSFPFFENYNDKIKEMSRLGILLCEYEIQKYLTSSGVVSKEFTTKNVNLLSSLSKLHKKIVLHEKSILNFLKNGRELNEKFNDHSFLDYVSLN